MSILEEPLSLLNELLGDFNVSRSVRARLEEVNSILTADGDVAVKCDKAIQVLTLIDDPNINSFVRTRIWSLLSLLESVSNDS